MTFPYTSERGNQIDKTAHWFLMRDKSVGSKPHLERTLSEVRFVTPAEAIELLTFGNDGDLVRGALLDHHTQPGGSGDQARAGESG